MYDVLHSSVASDVCVRRSAFMCHCVDLLSSRLFLLYAVRKNGVHTRQLCFSTLFMRIDRRQKAAAGWREEILIHSCEMYEQFEATVLWHGRVSALTFKALSCHAITISYNIKVGRIHQKCRTFCSLVQFVHFWWCAPFVCVCVCARDFRRGYLETLHVHVWMSTVAVATARIGRAHATTTMSRASRRCDNWRRGKKNQNWTIYFERTMRHVLFTRI